MWLIKTVIGSSTFEVEIKPEESSGKYKTIDDGHHLIIYNISENDVTSTEGSKLYACVATYSRLNAPYVGYYRYPRYKLKIVGELRQHATHWTMYDEYFH